MAQLESREIGERIALARRERGLTQEALAAMASFSERSLQDYERGATTPWKHLRELARLLNRPEEWFLYGEPESDAGAQLEDVQQALAAVRAMDRRLERIEEMTRELLERSQDG